jgi:hypothetical protein
MIARCAHTGRRRVYRWDRKNRSKRFRNQILTGQNVVRNNTHEILCFSHPFLVLLSVCYWSKREHIKIVRVQQQANTQEEKKSLTMNPQAHRVALLLSTFFCFVLEGIWLYRVRKTKNAMQ